MTLEHPLCIEAKDVQIDAIGVYDEGDGELLYVYINGRKVSLADVKRGLRFLCEDDADGWEAPLDDDLYTTLLSDSVASHWDDYADYKRGLMQDDE